MAVGRVGVGAADVEAVEGLGPGFGEAVAAIDGELMCGGEGHFVAFERAAALFAVEVGIAGVQAGQPLLGDGFAFDPADAIGMCSRPGATPAKAADAPGVPGVGGAAGRGEGTVLRGAQAATPWY